MALEMLLGGSVLILAVLLVRAVFGGRIGAELRRGLWLLALLRLLLPVSFGQLAASPANLVRVEREPERSVMYAVPVWTGTGMDIQPDGRALDPNSFGYALANQDGTVTRYASRRVLPDVLPVIWVTGMTAAAVWFALCNILFYRNLRKSRTFLCYIKKIPVYTAQTPSPCVFGLFRPAVYVTPEAAQKPDALSHVLAHEVMHLRHGDHIWVFLRTLCLTVWWFHPLVWAAAVLSQQDCELYCDASVIRLLGEEQRTRYGETLLSLAGNKRRTAAGVCSTLSGGGKLLRRRIQAIAQGNRPKVWAAAAAGALLAAAAVCAFSGARAPREVLTAALQKFF